MADLKISAAAALVTPALIRSPIVKSGNTGTFYEQHNIAASTSPGVGDDNTAGYHPGSTWFRIDTAAFYKCRSASTGAAVWQRVSEQFFPELLSGRYYFNGFAGQVFSPVTQGANNIVLAPFMVPNRCTISELTYRVGTTSAGANAAFGIYANDPATNKPTGNVLATAVGLNVASGSATNRTQALGANLQLEPGVVYWLGVNSSTTTIMNSLIANVASMPWMIGSTIPDNLIGTNVVLTSLNVSQTFGTWPDLTAASFTESQAANVPLSAYKVQSTP